MSTDDDAESPSWSGWAGVARVGTPVGTALDLTGPGSDQNAEAGSDARAGSTFDELVDSAVPAGGAKRSWRLLVEWGILIIGALAIALLVKTFLFQAFYIPSESMVPTLKIHDRVLVNKLSYDLHDVHRGDIVVFEAPPGQGSAEIKDLVKRVIGLPGDTVEAEDGKITIDGKVLEEPYLQAGTQSIFNEGEGRIPPNCEAPADGQPGCKVPAGSYFVMGDNRTRSKDARVFGPIKESLIVGRVFMRIWPPSRVGFL